VAEKKPEDDAPFVVPITGELDLHTFAPSEIASVVESYVLACAEKGIGAVRLVHGRGRGVQRAQVRRLLASLRVVRSFGDAPPESGHWGATLVELHSYPGRGRAADD